MKFVSLGVMSVSVGALIWCVFHGHWAHALGWLIINVIASKLFEVTE